MKVDTQEIRERLEAIMLATGEPLEAESVVEDARDPESPLHALFIWDDAKAAHEFRLVRAREIIRTVTVTLRAPAGATQQIVPVYVRDPETKSGYRELANVQTDKEQRRAVLAHEMRMFVGVTYRILRIAEALGEWKAIRAEMMAHVKAPMATEAKPAAQKAA